MRVLTGSGSEVTGTHLAEALEARIDAGTATVGVVGLGYVGLPLALAYGRRGFAVRGLDVDAAKVEALAAGGSYLRDVPAEAVRVQIETGRLAVGSDPAVLGECDAVFICVPTPFTQQKEPDVRHISEAAAQVARWGRPGQLVVLRSTSYPGTTEEVVRPALEGAGRVVGQDVFLAFAPERIDPGNTRYGVEDVPVVGGCDPSSARLVPMVEVPGARLTSQPLSDELVARADCVLILTDHSCVDYAAVVRRARLVLDVRNATAAVTEGREKIVRL